jgi:hypothetical protein
LSRKPVAEKTASRGEGRLRALQITVLVAAIASIGILAGQGVSSGVGVPPRLVVAQGLTDNTAEIAWTAEAGADTYRIYRDGALVTEEPGTRYDDSPLLASSTHVYAVSSVSGGVESPLSTPAATQTQAPEDSTPPSDPGSLSAANVTSDEAALDWPGSTDNVAVVAYRILRGPAGTPPDQLKHIATSESATSYTARDLKSGTSYQYGVMALDAQNNHSVIRTVTFTTAASSDTTPPAAPSNGGVRTIPFSSSRIDITWPTSTSDDVSSYRVYRNGVQVADVALPDRKTFSDVGLAPQTSYTYTIRAVDSAGNLSSPTSGKVGTTPAAGTVLIPRGPSIQWVTSNSARLAWWTNLPTASVAEYGVGALSNQATDPVLRTHHMMLIGGLTPGTSYQYRVGNGTVNSATSSFSTAAPPGSTFSFATVGDFGGGSPGEQQVADRIAAGGTQFTQTVGDNVYPDAQDPDFTNFYSDFDSRLYKQYDPAMANQAFWAGNGNHEYYGNENHWQNFWLPNNERWYSYDWGDAHFLQLDTEQPYAPGSPQYAFATADLAAHQDAKWRIVIMHRPPYSSTSNNSSSTSVRANLVPLFEQQNVQLVLTGHSHNYERTYPLIGDVPTTGGVVYIVTGGGGNGHNLFTIPPPSWSAARNDTDYQYTRVTVSPQSLQLDAIRGDTGAIFDSTKIDAPPDTGTIEVRKSLAPTSDQGKFDLQVDGQTAKTNASDGDTTGAVTVNAGSNHSIGETAGGATSLTDYASRVDCTRNGNPAESGSGTSLSGITVGTDDAVVCTVTNKRLGNVVVTKDAQPDDFRDFDFTAGGGLSPTSFQLDDDFDPTLSNSHTFDHVVPGGGSGSGGTYSVSEAVQTGWQLQSATCDDGSPVSAIDVGPGETVTCTFTNVKLFGYARPKSATPTTVRLVPAYAECSSPNSTHGPLLIAAACGPPVQSSSYLTVGSPDANNKQANSSGSVSLKVLGETPIDPSNGDQADVQITTSLTDVRNASDLSAYTGELQAVLGLRITDRDNDPGPDVPGTVQDLPFSFAVPCSSAGGPEGGACNLTTTADSITTDVVKESQRAIWELSQVKVYDGGADGSASTADNTLFAVQGLFAP